VLACHRDSNAHSYARGHGRTSWLGTNSTGAASQAGATPAFPCFKHHGRLTAYSNGIAVKIWLIGTTRVIHTEGDLKLPPDFDKYLDPTPPNSYGNIYGDVELCPLEPDTPGALRRVRVANAEKAGRGKRQRPAAAVSRDVPWPKQDTATSRKAP
jgi:hypothetical protein